MHCVVEAGGQRWLLVDVLELVRMVRPGEAMWRARAAGLGLLAADSIPKQAAAYQKRLDSGEIATLV